MLFFFFAAALLLRRVFGKDSQADGPSYEQLFAFLCFAFLCEQCVCAMCIMFTSMNLRVLIVIGDEKTKKEKELSSTSSAAEDSNESFSASTFTYTRKATKRPGTTDAKRLEEAEARGINFLISRVEMFKQFQALILFSLLFLSLLVTA